MSCLLLTDGAKQIDQMLMEFLNSYKIEFETASDQLTAIQLAHYTKYDVVILNAADLGQHIERAIHIFKECNPKVKIIVWTQKNSRDLETKVRKESIYYYHVESFGFQDLISALISALKLPVANPQSIKPEQRLARFYKQ